MTDDLIERLNEFMGEYGDARDECISQAADALTAAQARIDELEEQVRDTLKISELKREQGRLQGLDEAVAKAHEIADDTACVEVHSFEGEIAALKTQGQEQ